MDRIASMQAFAKAVETGSFSAAADALSVSPQMVGKHVRMLEEQLGVKLINRTTRRQSLTEMGRSFYGRVQVILAEVEAAEALAAETRAIPRGQLRVTAPLTFGAHDLSAILPQYMMAFPEVSIELVLNDRIVDLIDEGFDAAFRVGQLADSSLIVRSLKPMEFTICANPGYFAERGMPLTPENLVEHECLGFTHGTRNHWRFRGNNGIENVDIQCRLLVNSGQALLAAALAGLGITLQPTTLVEPEILAGRLVRVLPEYEPLSRPMHIVYAPDRQMTPKLRSFIDFVVAAFG